jgi:hypothetical protein
MPRVVVQIEQDRMTVFKHSAVLFVSLLTAGSAWGKANDPREKTARTACLSGDYAKGAALLSELYVETKNPAFIYNQGRCFEQNRRFEEAIARFEEYVRVGKKLSKADKAEAQKHIADCQSLMAKAAPGAAPGSTGAVEESSKEAKQRAAKKACLTGDPVAGVAILTDLYLDTSDPTYLFNQGRCFEQNRRYADAIGRFREYLEKAKGLSTADKADTERHIANCASYSRETPAEGARTATPNAQIEKAPSVERKPAEVVPASTEPGAGRPGRGLRIAGAVAAGVGVAGLATGLVLNLKANSMSSDLEESWNSKTNSTRQSYKTGAWAAYGTGAACVVGGAVLYYLGLRRGDQAAPVALVPAVGPDMAGTFIVGAF